MNETPITDEEEKLVGDILAGFALNVTAWHALPVSAEHVAIAVLASALAHHADVLEFCLPDRFARVATANLATLTPSTQETNFLVSRLPKRASAKVKAVKLASDTSFAERARSVEAALLCTLAEPAARSLWDRPLVKVACVLAFQFAHPPVECLELIFGSLVRSDLRRCDDLHESEAARPMEIVVCAEVLEVAAHALVA